MRSRKYQTVAFEKVSDNGLLLHGLDIFTFQIPIHTLKVDVPKTYLRCTKYRTMAFEKLSYKGLLLYGLDIFKSQISIHTLKLDVQKSTPIGENTRQWHLKKYQTMAFSYMV